ncbi:NHL repeat-containing protein [Geothrix fuzhouensis]|uniref:NHL repeat-containing protein n=1 Tax=Geothrix fuzhouensis TaxID=2966451 RepID=UPI002147A0FB|nr:NHL repeat-containing protein [Geothrix fuzhouensis]
MSHRSVTPRHLALVCAGLLLGGLELQAQTPVPVVAPVATPLRAYRNGLHDPARIAAGAIGRIYITDAALGRLYVRDESGRLLFIKDGLARPLGVAVDKSGRVFVGEAGTGAVSILLQDGTLAGRLGQGPGEFLLPNHITLDAAGQVYVADSAANLIKVYGPTGAKVREFGGAGAIAGKFDFPTGLWVSPAGEVFVADQNNNRIQVFTPEGSLLRILGSTPGRMGMGAKSPFGRIQGLAGDAQGRIYIADAFHGMVQVMDATTGKILSTIGSFGEGPGELSVPSSLAVDSDNRLLVVSAGSTRVEIFGLDTYADPAIRQAAFLLDQVTFTRGPMGRGSAFREEPEDGDEDKDGQEHPKMVVGHLHVNGVAPEQIIASTVLVNGVPAQPLQQDAIQAVGDAPAAELKLRFNIPALLATLPDGTSIVFITGRTSDGNEFEAATRVIVNPRPQIPRGGGGTSKKSHKHGGSR